MNEKVFIWERNSYSNKEIHCKVLDEYADNLLVNCGISKLSNGVLARRDSGILSSVTEEKVEALMYIKGNYYVQVEGIENIKQISKSLYEFLYNVIGKNGKIQEKLAYRVTPMKKYKVTVGVYMYKGLHYIVDENIC